MYFVCEKAENNLYGVKDTKDGVVEYYTPEQIKCFVDMGYTVHGYYDLDAVFPMVAVNNVKVRYAGEYKEHDKSKTYFALEEGTWSGRRTKCVTKSKGYSYTVDANTDKIVKNPVKFSRWNYINWTVASNRVMSCDGFVYTDFYETRFPVLSYVNDPEFHKKVYELTHIDMSGIAESDIIRITSEELSNISSRGFGGIELSGKVFTHDTYLSQYFYVTDKNMFFKFDDIRLLIKNYCEDAQRMLSFIDFGDEYFNQNTDSIFKMMEFCHIHVKLHVKQPYKVLVLDLRIGDKGITLKYLADNEYDLEPHTIYLEEFVQHCRSGLYTGKFNISSNIITIETLRGTYTFDMNAVSLFYKRETGGGDRVDLSRRKFLGGVADIWKNGELHSLEPTLKGIFDVPDSCTSVVANSIDLSKGNKLLVKKNVKNWNTHAIYVNPLLPYSKSVEALHDVTLELNGVSLAVTNSVIRNLIHLYSSEPLYEFKFTITPENIVNTVVCLLASTDIPYFNIDPPASASPILKEKAGCLGGTEFASKLDAQSFEAILKTFISKVAGDFKYFDTSATDIKYPDSFQLKCIDLKDNSHIDNYHDFWLCTSWAKKHSQFLRLERFFEYNKASFPEFIGSFTYGQLFKDIRAKFTKIVELYGERHDVFDDIEFK